MYVKYGECTYIEIFIVSQVLFIGQQKRYP